MKRRRAAMAAEIHEDETGTLSASWVPVMPRPALSWGERPVRCMLGRHRRVVVWETSPPNHLFGWWVTRCARCGVAL